MTPETHDWLLHRGGLRTGHCPHSPALRTSTSEWSHMAATTLRVDAARVNAYHTGALETPRVDPRPRLVKREPLRVIPLSDTRFGELLAQLGGRKGR